MIFSSLENCLIAFDGGCYPVWLDGSKGPARMVPAFAHQHFANREFRLPNPINN
jgi:hypothetical protein